MFLLPFENIPSQALSFIALAKNRLDGVLLSPPEMLNGFPEALWGFFHGLSFFASQHLSAKT